MFLVKSKFWLVVRVEILYLQRQTLFEAGLSPMISVIFAKLTRRMSSMLSSYVQNSRTVAPSPTLEPQERLAQNSEVINVNPQQNPCAQLLMLNVET